MSLDARQSHFPDQPVLKSLVMRSKRTSLAGCERENVRLQVHGRPQELCFGLFGVDVEDAVFVAVQSHEYAMCQNMVVQHMHIKGYGQIYSKKEKGTKNRGSDVTLHEEDYPLKLDALLS